MRIILLLGLITYWATHPGAAAVLLHVATLAVSALTHAGGAHLGVALPASGATQVLLFGSHWH